MKIYIYKLHSFKKQRRKRNKEGKGKRMLKEEEKHRKQGKDSKKPFLSKYKNIRYVLFLTVAGGE